LQLINGFKAGTSRPTRLALRFPFAVFATFAVKRDLPGLPQSQADAIRIARITTFAGLDQNFEAYYAAGPSPLRAGGL